MEQIRFFFSKVKKVLSWIPVIWNDRDWDGEYIVIILIKKLQQQRDYLLEHGEKERALEIAKAIEMLDKTKNPWEFYEEPAYAKLEKKWGDNEFIFKKVEGKEYLYNIVDIMPEDYYDDLEKNHDEAMEKYKQDKEKAYLYLSDNIDKWWN